MYNKLASESIFPEELKKTKLVLLRKRDKPLDDPSTFRPICLLDVEGKLYEQLLLGRLHQEVERTGRVSGKEDIQ